MRELRDSAVPGGILCFYFGGSLRSITTADDLMGGGVAVQGKKDMLRY